MLKGRWIHCFIRKTNLHSLPVSHEGRGGSHPLGISWICLCKIKMWKHVSCGGECEHPSPGSSNARTPQKMISSYRVPFTKTLLQIPASIKWHNRTPFPLIQLCPHPETPKQDLHRAGILCKHEGVKLNTTLSLNCHWAMQCSWWRRYGRVCLFVWLVFDFCFFRTVFGREFLKGKTTTLMV